VLTTYTHTQKQHQHSQTITVDYTTAAAAAIPGGSAGATSGVDYQFSSGTLTFPPGSVTATATVLITEDTLDEHTEVFDIVLSGSVNAGVAVARGSVAIADNDAAAVSVAPGSIVEGDSGSGTLLVRVALSVPSVRHVAVALDTFDTAAADSATAGADYVARTAVAVAFAPGVTAVDVAVAVLGDVVAERHETFGVRLSLPANATLPPATATATMVIYDNDLLQFAIQPGVAVTEPDSAQVAVAVRVWLSFAASTAQSVQFETHTVSGTATAVGATPGSDYTHTTGTLYFAAGETEKTIDVLVSGDLVAELTEVFGIRLFNAAGGTAIGAPNATATIEDNDTATVAVLAVAVAEGGGSGNAAVRAVMTGTSDRTVTVAYVFFFFFFFAYK
jgi:hypothetical protein